MNLREIAAKKLIEEIELPAAEEAWRNMYRNAHLFAQSTDCYTDFENDRERALFDNWLGDHLHLNVEWMEEYIREEFGLAFKIYQYGRCGATIAPDIEKFTCTYGMCRHFNRELDTDTILNWDDYQRLEDEEDDDAEWSEAYPIIVNYRKAFEYINEAVHAGVRALPEIWAEYKKENPNLFEETEEEEAEEIAA